ncbi:MAG: T9SS type A sorting domain-containing protein [Flavobacteriales bacterium]|nr:T9SS type A sorting domain-containing protein [Flavobacteriales bacterium]
MLLVPDASYMGNVLDFSLEVTNNGISIGNFILSYEHACSYDPNEKSASPVGYTDQHYIENTDEIVYTIHFQNTGTATATDVIIRDIIDENLDISTLQFAASSHSAMQSLHPVTRELIFYFNNIYLPDSSYDEMGSQGFVSYRIMPATGLQQGMQISNTASIYFDNNDPVMTNTMVHSIFDCAAYTSHISSNIDGMCADPMIHANADVSWSEQYTWTWNDLMIGNEPITSFNATEENWLKLEISNPLCGARIDSIWISLPELVELNITQSGNNLFTNIIDGSAYQWYLDGSIIEGSVSSSIEIQTSGNYAVDMMTSDGCIITTEMDAIYTSMEEAEVKAVVIFPNPAFDQLSMLIPTDYVNGMMTIHTIEGRLLSTRKLFQSKTQIDISKLSQGTYFITVWTEGFEALHVPFLKK